MGSISWTKEDLHSPVKNLHTSQSHLAISIYHHPVTQTFLHGYNGIEYDYMVLHMTMIVEF